jgi:hypothetical protein
VFGHPETGRPYDASKLRKRFKDAVGRAEIRPIRFHDLRHTFGTRMAAAGAPLRNIQEWMGHGDYRTTLIYADYAPDPVQGARWAEAAFSDAQEAAPDAPLPLGRGNGGEEARSRGPAQFPASFAPSSRLTYAANSNPLRSLTRCGIALTDQ